MLSMFGIIGSSSISGIAGFWDDFRVWTGASPALPGSFLYIANSRKTAWNKCCSAGGFSCVYSGYALCVHRILRSKTCMYGLFAQNRPYVGVFLFLPASHSSSSPGAPSSSSSVSSISNRRMSSSSSSSSSSASSARSASTAAPFSLIFASISAISAGSLSRN